MIKDYSIGNDKREILHKVEVYLRNNTLKSNMSVKEKYLFYENYLNYETNKFCGDIVISDVYLIKWINFLCDTPSRYRLFKDEFYNKYNFSNSMFLFRKFLLDSGRGQKINIEECKRYIHYHEVDKLFPVIQELFLEPFPCSLMDELFAVLDLDGTLEEIVSEHKNRTEARYLIIMKDLKNRQARGHKKEVMPV